MTCGASQPDRAPRAAPRAEPAQVVEAVAIPAGPQCAAHPGMPLVGFCPRCGKQVCIRCAPGAASDVMMCTDCLPLTAAHVKPPQGSVCAVHPAAAATFVCSRCGSFGCTGCIATVRGFEGMCVRCVPASAPLAGRGERFLANLIDNFVVIVPVGAGIAVGAVLNASREKLPANELTFVSFFAFAALLVGCGAQIVAQATWGQSLGKRLLKIKVVRLSGQPIELWRIIILRNLVVHVVSQACGIVGLVDALLIFGEDQRCIHDHLADSKVVVAQDP